jgi:hypothetical protein
MLTKIQDAIQTIKRQNYLELLPKVSALQQTKMSWARPIKSYTDVPLIYKNFFEPFLTKKRVFPYTVLTPSYEGYIHRTTEKLVCDFDSEVHILENHGDTYETHCYPYKEIFYVEARTILLYSSITISGVTKAGVPTSSTFEFNSTTDFLFTPILERIRFAFLDSQNTFSGPEIEEFNQLNKLNFKFMNYAKRSLLKGEKAFQSIFQPEIREKIIHLLGKTYYRRIFPTHLGILTDRELIMIREEYKPRGDDIYGGIWNFIHLNKIEALSLRDKGTDILEMTIQLPDQVKLEYLYQVSKKQEVNQLLERFTELTMKK